MSGIQRKKGQTVTIFPRKLIVDNRGNDVLVVDFDNPIVTKAAVIPQRSSKAEVPGQQQIDVVRLLLRWDLPETVGIWGRVRYDNADWDVVAPPARHFGTRATRHISLDIRRRPNDG